MFNFFEAEDKEKKQLEDRIYQLDNIARHWRSMYEKELRIRPTKVINITNEDLYKRTRALLEMHMNARDSYERYMILEELYQMYELREEKENVF